METKASANFWWLKSAVIASQDTENNPVVPKLDLHLSNSAKDALDKDKPTRVDEDVDVGSIIEEINRVAEQSPLGPYEKSLGDRSVEDLMKEAERIYMESSKSFEQLSQRSKTSQNISELLSNLSQDSTPTPKSLSPLPVDPDPQQLSDSDEDYTEDFSEVSKIESNPSPVEEPSRIPSKENNVKSPEGREDLPDEKSKEAGKDNIIKGATLSSSNSFTSGQGSDKEQSVKIKESSLKMSISVPKFVGRTDEDERYQRLNEIVESKSILIKTLEEHNLELKKNIQDVKLELEKTNALLEQARISLNAKQISSPEINLELERALEDLKDSREVNTALQLQIDTINKSHQLLKGSYDELVNSNKNLERRVVELDCTLDKYKGELLALQKSKEKLLENEANLTKMFELEKLQSKSLKLQNEKDARVIQDLNRQIKEMERIIARKHPDSVSALIVAAKENATDTSMTARKILEDRIKALEQEQVNRESQSSKVFLEIQEKFNEMKAKYENHIEDLELHVNDLKNQLKRKTDTYDVYTQTFFDKKIPQKETFTVFTQTDKVSPAIKPVKLLPNKKTLIEGLKEDSHLLATIKGLQIDLSNKEKVIGKLQREIDDLRKTNRRLQKEREGSLKSLSEKKEFRSYPEKLALQARSNSSNSEKDFRKDEELHQMKCERDRMKLQLKKLEEDYQALKNKRIQDLTALQEAHEREVSNYMTSLTPLREQMEVQRVSISTFQNQLATAKEELAVITAERDHLNERLRSLPLPPAHLGSGDSSEVDFLLKKISYMEKYYEEREFRLRAIVQSMAQKSVTNRSCEQCEERQKQLIAYKTELDQLLATVRALQ